MDQKYEEHLAVKRYEAMRDGEFEQAEFYQRELNRMRSLRIDNQRMMMNQMWKVNAAIDPADLTAKPGSVVTFTRYYDKKFLQRLEVGLDEQIGDFTGTQFITPITFHDERDVLRTPEVHYNIQLADGKWLRIRHSLFHKLKFKVMNMVYVEGTEIVDVYRHG